MTRAECQPRKTGMLKPEDQVVAQELFDYARSTGGNIKDQSQRVAVVDVAGGKKKQSMVLYAETNDIGQVLLKLRRGRRFWQDDGARGFAGCFGEGLKVGPEMFHPRAEVRDSVLRLVHNVFIKPQPQTK